MRWALVASALWLGAAPGEAQVDLIASEALEFEQWVQAVTTSGGVAVVQPMSGFGAGWGNDAQIFWRPSGDGESLLVPFELGLSGDFDLVLYYTVAPDYGNFSVLVNANPAATGVRGYAPGVERRSVSLGRHHLEGLETQILVTVEGKDPGSTGFVLGLDRLEVTPASGSAPSSVGLPVALTPPSAEGWVDAAVTTQGATYLFQGSSYSRFHAAQRDPGYPRSLADGGWKGLDANFQAGIDAALYAGDQAKTYLFKGGQYVRLTGLAVDQGYPRALPGEWQGLSGEFVHGIDAALFASGHVFFFKGGRYVRFTGRQLDPGYPADLPGGWELPPGFLEVDAAVEMGGKNYFFSGGSYVRLTGTRGDDGYPAPLPGGWVGLARSGSGGGAAPASAGPVATTGAGTTGAGSPSGQPIPAGGCRIALPTTALDVVVTRARDTGPIAGAKVEIYGARGLHLAATTDATGGTRFDLAEGGLYQVVVAGLGVDGSISRTVQVHPLCLNINYFDVGQVCDEIRSAADHECLTPEMQSINEVCNQTYLAEREECGEDEECRQAVRAANDSCTGNLLAEKAACVDDRLTAAGCLQ